MLGKKPEAAAAANILSPAEAAGDTGSGPGRPSRQRGQPANWPPAAPAERLPGHRLGLDSNEDRPAESGWAAGEGLLLEKDVQKRGEEF